MEPLELIAIVTSLGYVICNARLNIVTWLLGIIGSVLYVYIFAINSLYASAVLSCIFIAFMLYGWFSWKTSNNGQLPVSYLTNKARIYAFACGVILSPTIYYACKFTTGEAFPAGDAVIAGFSIVAQYLAAKKRIETWYGWIAVNCLAVYIYATNGLLGTAALYAVYIGLAIYGLMQWRKNLCNSTAGGI